MNDRERLGSRLGFILLSAGCAIGCGNVWKFPWMAGQYGGGAFVLIYVLCLILLGLPVMVMEFSLGRAAQASPVKMYQKLQKPGQKWHIHGYLALFGNICLMSFYTVVAGWILYYFYQFVTGQTADLGFVNMISNPGVNVTFMLIVVAIGFAILCFYDGFSGSLLYAYITYVGMSMCYTLVNVPYGALNASLTRDTNEITVLTSVRMFMANLGGLAVAYGVPKIEIGRASCRERV